jgi:ferredoxin--NADP+ reductase
MPWDETRGLIRNANGRVCDEAGDHQEGEYVVGWIKRGPSGVIGTNKKDAADTVARILEDRDAGAIPTPQITDSDEVSEWLRSRASDVVSWEGWQAIDAHERAAGEPHGRPRVKVVTLEQLLELARDV